MQFRVLLYGLFFLFASNTVHAQEVGLFINDSAGGIRVMNNTSLYIQGDFQVLSINPTPVWHLINGRVYLEGNMVCNDKILFDKDSNAAATSILHFVGNKDSYITGSVSPQLYQLKIDKSGGKNLFINRRIEVSDTIEFIQGNGIIDQNAEVYIDYHQGSSTVHAHPWLLNERAVSRFTGDGFVTTAIATPIFDYLPDGYADIANTGFYFKEQLTDSLHVSRGHTKQLYAGEGSIDRYFDVNFKMYGSNPPKFKGLGIRFIPDVNYSAFGVDTSKLRTYLSSTFTDATYVRAMEDFYVDPTRRNLTDTSIFVDPSNPTPISKIYYRVTLGDTTCTNAPFSTLPDTVLHLCAGQTVDVSAMNQQVNGFNQVSYYWNDGSTDVERTFSADSVYMEYIVKLTDQRGCFTYDTLRIDSIAPAPNVNFNWTNVCLGVASEMRDITTIDEGTFTSFWNFGDGNLMPNPTNDTVYHTFGSAAAYTVTLTSTSNYGCVSSINHLVDVFNYPTANLSISTNCQYGVMDMNSSGSTGTTIPVSSAITATTFSIDGADTTASTIYSFPLNTYSYGNHQADLIVTSGVGCSDTVTQSFTIYQQDVASFTASNFCLNDTLDIQNTSVVYNPNAVYSWNFGDGTYSTDFEPVKTYSTPGIKIIQLIVQTDAPCADTFELAVNIQGLPNSDFVTTPACIGVNVNFSPTVFDGTSNYSWDFGNGDNSASAFAASDYASAGIYTVSLGVTNSSGCSSTTAHTIQVMVGPQADFNALAVCEGNSTAFYNTSVGTSLSSQWSFGDFSNSTANNPQHLYGNDGTYFAQLIVTDASGCTDTIVHTVVVNPLPVIPVASVSTCGDSYILNAQNSGSTYYWTPVNETTQTITVTNDGTYSVQVTDANGCASSASATVTLHSIVQPDLGTDFSACGSTTLDAGYPGADFVWNTTETSQEITVTTAGTYWVQVTDQNACIGADTIEVLNVFPFNQPSLGTDQSLCETSFPYAITPGAYSSYLWSTGASTSSISLAGTSSVWVEVTDANGCVGRDTVAITSLNSPESILVASLSGCDQVTLVGGTNPGYDYLWGGGQTSGFIVANTSGTYTVTVTDPNTGCSIVSNSVVSITPSPVVNLGADQSVCANIGIVLDAQNPGSTYSWTSSSNVVVGTTQTYSPPSSGVYVVNVTNSGCSSSDAISVQLLPAPFIPDQTSVRYICGTTPVVLQGSPFGTNSWTSPNGFNSALQNVSVVENGIYTVVASIGGCSATGSFTLETSPMQIQANYLVDNDTTTNLSLKFVDLSEPTPISYYWTFGDGMFDTLPSPTHTYLVVDTYQTSLTVSNGFCISTYSKEVNAKDFFEGENNDATSLSVEDFIVYPNPVSNELTIEFMLTDNATTNLKMYDLSGKTVVDFGQIENEKDIQVKRDLTDLAPGSYYLNIQATSLKGNVQKVAKLIKL